MLAEADCLVVCAPLTPETDDLLGAAEFAALKPGAVFVNIGRGTIVDEDCAAARHCASGRIAFAALDVFREEPLPADSPFWDMPNVLINPHSASTVDTENAKLTELFIRNLGHYLAGEIDQMAPLLDKQRLYYGSEEWSLALGYAARVSGPRRLGSVHPDSVSRPYVGRHRLSCTFAKPARPVLRRFRWPRRGGATGVL